MRRSLIYVSFISLALIMLTSNVVGAQTAEPTWPAMSDGADPQLTLVWQTETTPEALLDTPSDITVDSQGNAYVSMQGKNHLKKYDKDGKLVAQFAPDGFGDGQLSLTAGLSTDWQDNLYVADFSSQRIEKFDSSGKYLAQWATGSPGGPASVAVDKDGNSYVDNFGTRDSYIEKFDSRGKLVTQWGTYGSGDGQFRGSASSGPEDIAVDGDGNVYVADRLNHRIQKFDSSGKFLVAFGGEGSMKGHGLFQSPLGVAVDAQGNIYVVDVGSQLLQKLDAKGNFIAQWSTDGGDLDDAAIVAVDAQGDLYLFASVPVKLKNGNTIKGIVLKKFSQPK